MDRRILSSVDGRLGRPIDRLSGPAASIGAFGSAFTGTRYQWPSILTLEEFRCRRRLRRPSAAPRRREARRIALCYFQYRNDRGRDDSAAGSVDRAPRSSRGLDRISRVTGELDALENPDSELPLEPGESVVARLPGFGASLFVTTHRLIIVRDRAGFRPRSGIRSWPLDAIVGATLLPPSRGQARIVVRAGPRPEDEVSMFFEADLWPDAARTATAIRKGRGRTASSRP